MRQTVAGGRRRQAERRRGLKVVGTVVSGLGTSGSFLAGPWVAGRHTCGIMLPLVDRYPECIIEIVAPVHLKETLRVKDGGKVEVKPFSNTDG